GGGEGAPALSGGATRGAAFAGPGRVYDGATGSAIWQFGGASSGSHFGGSVAGAGDTDGDGFADLIVGAEEAEPGGRVRAGSAYVYSGATGSLLRQFDGAAAGDALGYSVSGAGDVDGDGAADLVVGALRANPGGLMGAGSAFVYSGASGSLIWQFDGASEHDFLGVSVSGAGDLDGDGHADLLVGATGVDLPTATNVGAASVYSGATGGLLGQFVGAATDDELGRAVAGAGDVDADGTPDLIVGAQPAWGTAAGSAFVYSLDPFLHAGARQLSATPGNPVPLTLDFPASEAGSSHAVLFSGAGTGPTIKGGLAIPLSQDNIFDRMLTGWSPPPLSNGFGVLDANGDAQASLDGDAVLLPLIGRTVYLAAVSYDPLGPTGRLSSIARALTIVP
nr:FG-GAP repeat protein [Planctomycetota bacterium]